MDRRTLGGARWTIAYGAYEGIEGYAVDELCKVVQRNLPYILTVHSAAGEAPEPAGFHVLLTGTPVSSPRIAELVRGGAIRLGTRPGSFAISVGPSAANPQLKLAVLAGTDPSGVLFAVRDFEHFYADPSIYRGLWTWGHVIYDYRRYLQTYWTRNLGALLETLRVVKKSGVKRASATGLVEDGLWERRAWLPAALLGESLWEPDQDASEILRKVSFAQDVSFA